MDLTREIPKVASDESLQVAVDLMLSSGRNAVDVHPSPGDPRCGILTWKEVVGFISEGGHLGDARVADLLNPPMSRRSQRPARRGPRAAVRVSDVMDRSVIACRPDAYFEEIAELLADREISGLPVVNHDDQVIGVISERDLAHALGGPLIRLVLRRPVRSGPFLRELHHVPRAERRAGDIMTTPPVVARPNTSLQEAAKLMVQRQVNRLPVVDEDMRLLGVVTRGDLLAGVAGVRREDLPAERSSVILGGGSPPGTPGIHHHTLI